MLIAGVDEAGRGPLAGPVVAAAVILDPAVAIEGLADSKKLTATKREKLAQEIKNKALAWAVGRSEVDEIDEINILRATMKAMERAVHSLAKVPERVLVDGNQPPHLPTLIVETIIKGDDKIAAISAASIIAKVTRDEEMIRMDCVYPGYEFARHKGYGSQLHMIKLKELGASPIHRRSFAPVRRVLQGAV
ncbi:MAG: ribonuclease HII [Gammaproteobacteria bacterium]|nr:ribonuclease HII [Gammaproteobacteria bacterium]